MPQEMKKTFIQRYSDAANCPTMVLRSIFRELTDDSSAASSSKQADVHLRVAQFLLSLQMTDLILDLGSLNGQPGSTKFNAIWEECQKYFDELWLQSVSDAI